LKYIILHRHITVMRLCIWKTCILLVDTVLTLISLCICYTRHRPMIELLPKSERHWWQRIDRTIKYL